jgi:putative hydrolase of the HAD superfamily
MSEKRPIRAVLLDGMGTLLALDPPWPAFAGALHRDHGVTLTLAQAQWAFASEMAYYRAHHHEGCDPSALAGLRRRCAEVLRDALPASVAQRLSPEQVSVAMLGALRFSAHADALATLPLLRARGLTLIAVSNWDVSLSHVLAGLGLDRLLDGVVTSAQVGRPKPAPEVFQAALALARVAPQEAVHVGDDPYADTLGARAAGIRAVLLCREEEPVATYGAAEHTISSLAQLPSVL